MSRLSIKIILILLLISSFIQAQHESDFWYFGNYAGLDFSSGNPEPVSNGVLKNYEGCASISDSAGNLLFYTNGITVWNRNHQIMINGTGLTGDTSSTQSSIIVPWPGNDSLYYIFTTDDLQNSKQKDIITDGFRYSTVNMNMNSGEGELIEKNILLLDSVTEKITAVRHLNGKDIWVLTHEWGTDKFFAWLIDNSGISATPVISSVGSIHQYDLNSIGYMKVSPNGKKLALAILYKFKYEIFDFDNAAGSVSDPMSIYMGFPETTYGCEYSPDGSRLYLTTPYKLFQADMNAGNETDIQNSVTEIHEFSSPVGALQLAKNGKLYISTDVSASLSVINKPNETPLLCDFNENSIYLEGKISRLGLPNFIQSYFFSHIKTENNCYNDLTKFYTEYIYEIDSVIWNFDDPASGNNISRLPEPEHLFSLPGLYNVSLTVWFNNFDYHYSKPVKIVPAPELQLGNDTVLCYTDQFILDAYAKHYSYLWNDLSSDSALTVIADGKYWVDIQNIYTGCKNSDTINIIFAEIPEIDLGNDTSFCENASFLIDAYHDDYSYLWQDGTFDSFFTTVDEGEYFVKVTNLFGCENSDTINLTYDYLPRFNFPDDTVLCNGYIFGIDALSYAGRYSDLEDATYLWQDGSNESSYLVNASGIYSLQTENKCGTWEDEFVVDYKFCDDIYIPNIISPNSDDLNEIFKIRGIENDVWKLVIYNRWGKEVITYEEYDNSWSGKDKFNNELSEGVYFYILTNQELEKLYKGTVRIIR